MTDMAPTTGVSASSEGDGSAAGPGPVRRFDYALRARIMTLAAHDHALSRTEIAVLSNILARSDANGASRPGAGRIAQDIGASERQVRRSVEKLRRQGWIDVLSGKRGRANLYRVRAEGTRQQALMTRLGPGVIRVTHDTHVLVPMTPMSGGPMTPTSPQLIESKPIGGTGTAAPTRTPALAQALMEAWNTILTVCPPIKGWTPKRQQLLQALIDCETATPASMPEPKPGEWGFEPSDPSWWADLFRHIADNCPFLMGQVPGTDGRAPFVVTVDWMLKHDNLLKVFEGQFQDGAAA
ncbi:MAG: helix-turn-helix domain-containing protein [Xanthomonadaceae bacterium]|jgi:DNA-binding MarR family transcriptional regulator|nr:helix-turn-helix domain-containing protein [Xanthomonadaceae bacterium]